MLLALAVTAQLLAGLQDEGDSPARVDTLPPSTEGQPAPLAPAPPPAPAPERGASLSAGPTTQRKSTGFLIAGGGIVLGAVGGYLGLVAGVLVNFSKGGLSDPIDVDDALLLMVIPATAAAAFSWVIGLFDLSQRTFVGSAIWAILGAAVGEGVGLGAGYLLGRAMFPNDAGTRGLVLIAMGPALAAIGAVLFMELFKPGEEVGPAATLSVTRDATGALAFGPALVGRF